MCSLNLSSSLTGSVGWSMAWLLGTDKDLVPAHVTVPTLTRHTCPAFVFNLSRSCGAAMLKREAEKGSPPNSVLEKSVKKFTFSLCLFFIPFFSLLGLFSVPCRYFARVGLEPTLAMVLSLPPEHWQF